MPSAANSLWEISTALVCNAKVYWLLNCSYNTRKVIVGVCLNVFRSK